MGRELFMCGVMHLTRIRLQSAIYFCLHAGSLPENTARRQPQFEAKLAAKIFRQKTICQTKSGALGFIDRLDPLSWFIKVKLVVEAGQIRAGLLDNAFRECRKLCSGNRPAGRLVCPSIMGVGDNLHVVGMALSVELECTFHGHAMNPFRMLHELCKHHSTSDVSGLKCIRSPDGIAVCRVRMGWPELHRHDHK